MISLEERLGRGLERWVGVATRRPAVTLGLAVAFTALCGVLAFFRLGVVSDTDELFDARLPFRAQRIVLEEALPLRADTILVVVDGPTDVAAGNATERLAERIRAEGDPFAAVFTPGLGPFFERNGFLYLEPEELEDLADDLAPVQPFLAALRVDPSVRGVFGQLELALARGGDRGDELVRRARGNGRPRCATPSASTRTPSASASSCWAAGRRARVASPS